MTLGKKQMDKPLRGRRFLFFIGDFAEPFLDGHQSSILGWLRALGCSGAEVAVFSPISSGVRNSEIRVRGIRCFYAHPPGKTIRCLLSLWRRLNDFSPDFFVLRTLAFPTWRHWFFWGIIFILVAAKRVKLGLAPWGGKGICIRPGWQRWITLIPPLPIAGLEHIESPGIVFVPGERIDSTKDIDFLFMNGSTHFGPDLPHYLLCDRGLGTVLETLGLLNKKHPVRLLLAVPALEQDEGKNWIEEELSKRGLHHLVEIGGVIDNLAAVLSRTRFFLLPHSFADTFWYPHSVLEAMYLGAVPLLTENAVGRFLIEDGKSGLLVHPQKSEELARKLGHLLAVPQCYEKMRQAAHQEVLDRFGLQARQEEIGQVFSRLMG